MTNEQIASNKRVTHGWSSYNVIAVSFDMTAMPTPR